jgi:hypothetical protein
MTTPPSPAQLEALIRLFEPQTIGSVALFVDNPDYPSNRTKLEAIQATHIKRAQATLGTTTSTAAVPSKLVAAMKAYETDTLTNDSLGVLGAGVFLSVGMGIDAFLDACAAQEDKNLDELRSILCVYEIQRRYVLAAIEVMTTARERIPQVDAAKAAADEHQRALGEAIAESARKRKDRAIAARRARRLARSANAPIDVSDSVEPPTTFVFIVVPPACADAGSLFYVANSKAAAAVLLGRDTPHLSFSQEASKSESRGLSSEETFDVLCASANKAAAEMPFYRDTTTNLSTYTAAEVDQLLSDPKLVPVRRAPDPIVNHTCLCGITGDGHLVCGKCGTIRYCSRLCQVSAWKTHRFLCHHFAKLKCHEVV